MIVVIGIMIVVIGKKNLNVMDIVDGDYCAEIDYYYSKTGTESTYTLKVEIEDNELVKIYWPNGDGWTIHTIIHQI